MTVWIVTYTSWEETYICSVWPTEEEAEKEVELLGSGSRYDVEEWEVSKRYGVEEWPVSKHIKEGNNG